MSVDPAEVVLVAGPLWCFAGVCTGMQPGEVLMGRGMWIYFTFRTHATTDNDMCSSSAL